MVDYRINYRLDNSQWIKGVINSDRRSEKVVMEFLLLQEHGWMSRRAHGLLSLLLVHPITLEYCPLSIFAEYRFELAVVYCTVRVPLTPPVHSRL